MQDYSPEIIPQQVFPEADIPTQQRFEVVAGAVAALMQATQSLEVQA